MACSRTSRVASIRQMQYSINKLDTFAVVTAGVATGHKIKPFSGEKWIDFAGPSNTFPSVSYAQAYYGTTTGTKTGPKLLHRTRSPGRSS